MKKSFKGFTLVECIVALAILGVASLTMAQIYATVSLRNKNNQMINTSLSNQMAYVETYTDSEAYPIYYNGSNAADTSTVPPHENAAGGANVKIVSSYNDYEYSYAADIYVLKSRDRNDKDNDDAGYVGEDEDNYNLRYKYILGHNN